METRKRALASTQAHELDFPETSDPGQSSHEKSRTQMVEVPEHLQHLTYGTTMSTIGDLVSKVPNTQIAWSPQISALVGDWAKEKQFTKTRPPTSDDLFELLQMPILNSLTSPEGWAISGWRTIDTIVLGRVLAKIERSLSTKSNSFTWPKQVKDDIVEQALNTINDYGSFGRADGGGPAGPGDSNEGAETEEAGEQDDVTVEGSDDFGVSQLGSIMSPMQPTPQQRSAHERSLLPSLKLDTDGFDSARFWPKSSGIPVARKVESKETTTKPNDELVQRPGRSRSLSMPRLKTPLPKPKPSQEPAGRPGAKRENQPPQPEKPQPQPGKPMDPPNEAASSQQENTKPSVGLAMWWGRAMHPKAAALEENAPPAQQFPPSAVEVRGPSTSAGNTTSTNAPVQNPVSRIPKPFTRPYTKSLFDRRVPSQSPRQEPLAQPQVTRGFRQAHRAPVPVPKLPRRRGRYEVEYLEIPHMSWVMAADASEMTDWQLEDHYRALQDLMAELKTLEERAERALL
ncbi:Hypothetical predicted protein [Lecanosticta acicola]|uniref:Uncharacterized protein n=1 Tax=Lecanosticta acicola TaxID=111012 RepID=A0AAI8Z6E3_9PEZI|nr:Hypothetical predicted protein [Lecanosticta acicola]